MQPIDLLTDEDKELIFEYVSNYSGAEPQSIEKILDYWNKKKKKLLKVFGNQLRISIPIDTHQETSKSFSQKIRAVYSPLFFYDEQDILNFTEDPRNHLFLNSLKFWFKEPDMLTLGIPQLKKINRLLSIDNVTRGCIDENFIFTGGTIKNQKKDLKIPIKTKTMRAIRKVLEYYGYKDYNLFDKWRDDISVAGSDKKVSTNLVFSIHPIDYMTMSDNGCGWSSCMSWIENGGYSTGTIEMLNSNMAIVVYTESRRDFILNDKKIPNKSWRTLMFVCPEIAIVGKNYPYQSDFLAKQCLDYFQKIAKENVNWDYKFKKQLYKDMIHSHSNEYIKNDFYRLSDSKHHKIYTYMNIMYHDMICDHYTDYWCSRNYVKKNLYLNLSGKATCMCCGEPIDKYDNDNISTSKKYCYDCEKDFKCEKCGRLSVENKDKLVYIKVAYGYHCRSSRWIQICEDCCLIDYLFDPAKRLFVSKDKEFDYIKYNYNIEGFSKVTRELLKEYKKN